jgi:hypothetical protein
MRKFYCISEIKRLCHFSKQNKKTPKGWLNTKEVILLPIIRQEERTIKFLSTTGLVLCISCSQTAATPLFASMSLPVHTCSGLNSNHLSAARIAILGKYLFFQTNCFLKQDTIPDWLGLDSCWLTKQQHRNVHRSNQNSTSSASL